MTDITAPITAVTVYADRALVTRKGKVTLEAGEHEVRVNNLPQFLRDSLRASGHGPQGTRILNVDITTAFYPQPPEEDLARIQTELDALQHQQKLLQARQEALNDRRQWLRALGEQSRDFARGLAQGQMKPQDCSDFFSFMSAQATQDAEAALQLQAQIQQVQSQIDARQREYYQRQGDEISSDRQAALITVELASAGELELEISYLVRNASWYPQYDIRVHIDGQQPRGTVELTYIGMVQQSTGENWDHIELALSTARPSQAAILPELQPWYLKEYNPPPPRPLAVPMAAPMSATAYGAHPTGMLRSRVAAPGGSFALEEDEIEPPAPAPVEAEIATATVERSGTALVFRVGRSVDIPSDNSPHKTTIARDDLPCEFDYVSAPALETNAHMRATVVNSTERILLDGQASIFLDAEYVGTTRLDFTAAREEFKIFLGIDDSLKIKREPIERAVDKGNLLQGDIRRSTYAYRISVHNYATAPRKVVIKDHIPVPQHERIKVRVQSITPQPAERTRLELLTWEQVLPANGEYTIEYRFVVEHPQGLRVVGLP
ncbi:mucoidy inhibitor MuiA family protein [Dictyobacter aurantiacus]|uniref:Mucoidy inhibitor MuiA family protein n=1 Tax=Dictyobacter aurantiacus TaxID=1936993 RepID=A0A401ZHF9_9CHLR|nr:mucoidy inhibitor MuiA family protein [Dictyobacter aurantiacus]GCE06276.1 hypothetical protein KDAU_36050 [Dictyobacter aurantiacus]